MSQLAEDIHTANMLETLEAVPIWQANAVGWRDVARRLGKWAPRTIRGHLMILAAVNEVRRVGTNPVRFWRDGTSPTRES